MNTQFVVIVGHALTGPEVVGPFPHEEDAVTWAKAKYKSHVVLWRVAPIVAPEAA